MYETISGSKTGTCEGLLYLPEISAARVLLSSDGFAQSKVIRDIEKLSGAGIKVQEEPMLGRLVAGKGLSQIEVISKFELMQANTSMPQEDFTYQGRVYQGNVWGGTLHARFTDIFSKDLKVVSSRVVLCESAQACNLKSLLDHQCRNAHGLHGLKCLVTLMQLIVMWHVSQTESPPPLQLHSTQRTV
jgi:hypothetical protein